MAEESLLRKNWIMFMFMFMFMSYFVISTLSTNQGIVPIHVIWHAPFYSGGGYCSEAKTFLQSFITANLSISIAHHGDSINDGYIAGLSHDDMDLLIRHDHRRSLIPDDAMVISICHSEPGAWYTPRPKYHTSPCPRSDSHFNIGRTMFETDRFPDGWLPRLDYMDQIWVPTQFSYDTFVRQGFNKDKLMIIGEPVDTSFYSPSTARMVQSDTIANFRIKLKEKFVFLFVGKWEKRKGIDILIKAFYQEFIGTLDVRLVILTNAYHSSSDFIAEICRILKLDSKCDLGNIELLSEISQQDMPAIYDLADVLVMPSCGEGWGRPHVEAMSSGVPIIATNWSGPVSFVNNDNSYLLDYELEASE
jgi:glycosyltransferase involved in cell wall biosynthesis